jgi:hypothetical protein
MASQEASLSHPQLAAEPSGAHALSETLGTVGQRSRRGDSRAPWRTWGVRPRRCRALARELRRTAALTEAPSRFDRITVPVLLDRVAAAQREMLDLAAELERSSDPNPEAVATVRELLRDGCSPIYNPNVAAIELMTALGAARAALDRTVRA